MVGGSSVGSSIEAANGAIFIDGTATISISGDSVTIDVPPIRNASSTLTTGNLELRLGHFDAPEFFGQTFFTAAEFDLAVSLDPFAANSEVSVTVPFTDTSAEGFDYLHLSILDLSQIFPVLAWQTVAAPGDILARSFLLESVDTLSDTDSDGVSDFNEALMQTDPTDDLDAPGRSTIDVMVLYTPGVADLYMGEPEARIVQELELGNQVLETSGVDADLRLVHIEQIEYSEAVYNLVAIDAMQLQAGVFSSLEAVRLQVGADLVLLFRPTILSDDNCGIGGLTGVGQDGDFANVSLDFVVSVIYADCRDNTAIHEIGHNLGLAHSTRDAGSNKGTFDWSRGHGVDAKFCTIMADVSNFPDCVEVEVFSNPEIDCIDSGLPCGVDRSDADFGADAALSLNTVRFQVAAFAPDPPDSDMDGLINFVDADDDNDGVDDIDDALPLDAAETVDTDGDGIGNNADTDDDGDGLTDVLELSLGLDPLDPSDVTGSPREILWRHAQTGKNVLWSMESQHRVERNTIPTVSDSDWKVAGMADFNGDGMDEIFFRHQGTGSNRLWNIEDGARTSSDVVRSVSTDWFIIGMGDFDADGDDDLMWRNGVTGANRYWEMDGTSRLSSLPVRSVGLTWAVAGSGDFDGDGRNDLFWRSSAGSNIVWLMQSEVRVARGVLPGVSSAWEIVGVGDFDGDGMDDVLWHNATTGANSIWLLNGAERKSRASIPRTSLAWRPFGVLDMDGDGMADILLRNNISGANRLWLMNGTSRRDSLAITSVRDQRWEPVAVGNVLN